MPLMTTSPYSNAKNQHHFILNNADELKFFIDVAQNNNIEKLNIALDSGFAITKSISWEFAISTSSPNINYGAPMNVIFDGKTTLLHAFIFSENMNVLQSLINHQVDLNQYGYFTGTYNGYKPVDGTPLHVLMEYFDTTPDFLELMLDNGAQLNILNSSGETPLQCAKNAENTVIVNFLEDYIQSHNLNDQKTMTIMEYKLAKYAEIAELNKNIIDAHTCNTTDSNDESISNNTITETSSKGWVEWVSDVLNNWFPNQPLSEVKLADVLNTNNEINFGVLSTQNVEPSNESVASNLVNSTLILPTTAFLENNTNSLTQEFGM